jgi:hypothetical protein
MEMGFMAWALPLDSRSGICREPAKGTGKKSQSNLYYPGAGSGFPSKRDRGNLDVDPLFGDQGLGISFQFSNVSGVDRPCLLPVAN